MFLQRTFYTRHVIYLQSSPTEPVRNPSPRVCVLKKKERETFGFYLTVEKGRKGHIIRQIDAQGVAERSGLRDGDCLLEVNEMFVDNMHHKEVIGRDLWLMGLVIIMQSVLTIWNKILVVKVSVVLYFSLKVIRMIQASGSHICFLVLDGQVYDLAVSEGRDLKELAKVNRGEGWRPPRLCHITKNATSGLGFNILPFEGTEYFIFTTL